MFLNNDKIIVTMPGVNVLVAVLGKLNRITWKFVSCRTRVISAFAIVAEVPFLSVTFTVIVMGTNVAVVARYIARA